MPLQTDTQKNAHAHESTAGHPHPHPHSHDTPHDHPHDDADDHAHDHPHPHDHHRGLWGWISAIFHLHGHSHQRTAMASETAFMQDDGGIRTVWLALAALTITAIFQIVIVRLSGSVALLADTIHNVGDGLNSIPLLIAFYLARRIPTRRYTYGFARAEDVAGVLIVLSIAVSAAIIFWESFQKLLHPAPLTNLGWIAAASIVEFLGNEAVAWLQIRKGREIGSAALVADGLHARTDGFTSLAVLVAVAGTWLGYPIVDPIIGFTIGIAILFITKEATVSMWYRLMDAIEPEILEQTGTVIRQREEVRSLQRLRMRWMGHQLHADICIGVDANLTTAEGHHIADHIREDLLGTIRRLADVTIQLDPWSGVSAPGKNLTEMKELARE